MPVRAAPRFAGAVLVPALLLGMLAAPRVAAVSGVPDDGAIKLPGDRVLAAMVGDVNGDGVRDLIRLVPGSANPGQMAVEADAIRDGSAVSLGEAALQRTATTDDVAAGRRPTDDGLLPLQVTEPARLVAWRDGGREQVLVATIGSGGLSRPCCLTLWRVSLDSRGRTAVELMGKSSISAAAILAEDLDGDGTDELVVLDTADPDVAVQQLKVQVLNLTQQPFTMRMATARDAVVAGPLFSLGDSDGQPGNEVGFLQPPNWFDQLYPTLYRISLDAAGQPTVERGALPDIGQLAAVSTADGGRLVLVNELVTALLDWPAGVAQPEVALISRRGGALLGVVGSSLHAAVLVARGGSVDVLDGRLASRMGVHASAAAARLMAPGRAPFQGPLPGAGAGGDDQAFVFAGRLITLQPDAGPQTPGFVHTTTTAALPGLVPVGLFGPRGAWVAVGVQDPLSVARRGGPMASYQRDTSGAIWVEPAPALFTPETDDGLLAPPVDGGVPDPNRSVPTLLTAGRLEATVSAPPGSKVLSVARIGQVTARSEDTIGAGGSSQVVLSDSTTGAAFTAEVQVITPGGHGYAARWEIRVIEGSPTLHVEPHGALLSFEVPIAGTTEPGNTVKVDGEPTPVASDGTFQMKVSAGLLPRTVSVTATDPLGRTAEETVSVVALFDYRTLPWIPITTVVTVLLALFLFVRAPRARPARSGGHGTLEEIE
jgi:hypothetical protein